MILFSIVIFLIPTAVIEDRRLIIVVTQHDLSYRGVDTSGEMNARQVRSYVQDGLKKSGFEIEVGDIIPVSGEWALTARQLEKARDDRMLLRKARKYLMEHRESQPHRGDVDLDKEVANLTRADISKELENISRIQILEKRYV